MQFVELIPNTTSVALNVCCSFCHKMRRPITTAATIITKVVAKSSSSSLFQASEGSRATFKLLYYHNTRLQKRI